MVYKRQKDEAKLLFVNKSASNASLSHSEAEEGLNIRRFIQRRNRRIERAMKKVPPVGPTQEQLCRKRPLNDIRLSSDITANAIETVDTVCRGSSTAGPEKPIERTEWPKKWIFYSARGHEQELPRPWLTAQADHQVHISRRGPEMTVMYRPIRQRPCWSSAECRGSDYFMAVIAAKFTSAECSIFWSVFLPCVIEEDARVRLLAIGLALMHESYDLQELDPQRAQERYEQALVSCNKAITCIQRSANTMPKASLDMTCILIVSIEMLRGDLGAAEACLDSGLAMAGTSRGELVQHRWEHPIPPNDSTSCQRAIKVTQAKMSGAFHVFGTRSERNEPHPKFHPVLPPPIAHFRFTNLEDVNTTAEMLYSATLRALENPSDRAAFIRGSMAESAMLDGFENFHQGLESIRACGFESTSTSEVFARTTIQEVKVLEAQITFNCIVLDNDEMSFDNWNLSFEKMLRGLANKLETSTSDPSRLMYHPFSAVFVAPLWLIASRCRVSQIRRHAIHLLRTYRRRETVHDSLIAATLAQHIVTIEEGSKAQVEKCSDVQRSHRVKLVAAEYVPVRGCVRLEYVRGFSDHVEPKATVQEWIPYSVPDRCRTGKTDTPGNALLQALLTYS